MGFVTIVNDIFLKYIFLFVAQVNWPLLILYTEFISKKNLLMSFIHWNYVQIFTIMVFFLTNSDNFLSFQTLLLLPFTLFICWLTTFLNYKGFLIMFWLVIMFQNWVCYLQWILIDNIHQGRKFPSIPSLLVVSLSCTCVMNFIKIVYFCWNIHMIFPPSFTVTVVNLH